MVNIEPTEQAEQQPMSDDQELAKVLAGVGGQADDAVAELNDDAAAALSAVPAPVSPPEESPQTPSSDAPETAPTPSAAGDGSLDDIKKDAIVELRPLVDKLSLDPEEKFDTYLLLLRSTDDRNLVAPAHEAAKAITDEGRRAEALLNIIKEIDFLSGQQPAA